MDQLQKLDGELDVADAALSPFQLPVGQALTADGLLSPGLQLSYLSQLVSPERAAPDPGSCFGREGRPERRVTGDRPGLEQGLELPGLGPAVPVGQIGGERSGRGTGPPFRAQVQVDPPRRPRQVQKSPRVAVRRLRRHQQQIHVARIVELPPAQLAHANDRQAPAAGRGCGSLPGQLQEVGCQLRQPLADRLEWVEAEEVAGRDTQQFQAFEPRQFGRRAPTYRDGRGGERVIEAGEDIEGGRVGDAHPPQPWARRRHRHHGRPQGWDLRPTGPRRPAGSG